MSFKCFLVVGFCFNLMVAYAQPDTLYVDEDIKYISKSRYQTKLKSGLFQGKRFSTDTLVLEQLRLSYCFGKLDSKVKSQFFKLQHSRNHIDTTKTIIIHYGDTLRSPSEYKKELKGKFVYSFAHEYKNSFQGFVSAHKACIKRNRKYRKTVQVLHFFGVNNGQPTSYKGQFWYKDYGLVLKKMFFSGYLDPYQVIIRPNGEFFVGYYYGKSNHDFVKKKQWDKSKTEFENKLKALKM